MRQSDVKVPLTSDLSFFSFLIAAFTRSAEKSLTVSVEFSTLSATLLLISATK